jgi:hypothetical protein
MDYIKFESNIIEQKAKAELKKINSSDDLFVKIGAKSLLKKKGQT